MATRPASPQELMTLGMFVFGMATIAYQGLTRARDWNHAVSPRIGARDASQYVGPGQERITLGGLIVPEVAGSYSALETLSDMADAGEDYPLMDGQGRVLGHYRITRLDEDHVTIMAGGIPRQIDFSMELERSDDPSDNRGIAF